MKKPQVSFEFKRYSDANLWVFGDSVLHQMTGNLAFPSPYPDLVTLQTAVDEFELALNNAQNGGKLQTQIKRQKKAILLDLFTKLAKHIEIYSNYDASILLTTGFVLTKSPSKNRIPSMPTHLRLSDGEHSGEILVRFQKGVEAIVYDLRYTTDIQDKDSWIRIDAPFTRASYVLTDLTPTLSYWLQVRAINRHGSSEWSDPATWMVR